jgi:hypothetical protein
LRFFFENFFVHPLRPRAFVVPFGEIAKEMTIAPNEPETTDKKPETPVGVTASSGVIIKTSFAAGRFFRTDTPPDGPE